MTKEIEIGEFDLDSFMSESTDSDCIILADREGVTRQVVFVIDASNSMQGYKIGAVNDCVNNIISKLRVLDHNQGDKISLSVIGFSAKLFRWTDSFVRASEFKYSYVEMVDGLTDMNAVFNELTILTNSSMEKGAKKFVVLFSDGLSTEDYTNSLEKWTHTGLYPEIVKIVVAFDGDLQDPQSVTFFREFVGSGLVLSMREQEQLLSALLS